MITCIHIIFANYPNPIEVIIYSIHRKLMKSHILCVCVSRREKTKRVESNHKTLRYPFTLSLCTGLPEIIILGVNWWMNMTIFNISLIGASHFLSIIIIVIWSDKRHITKRLTIRTVIPNLSKVTRCDNVLYHARYNNFINWQSELKSTITLKLEPNVY